MEKFFVYVFSLERQPEKLFVTEVAVKAILQIDSRLEVVRPSTSQSALLIGDLVVWKDIPEVSLKDISDGFQPLNLEKITTDTKDTVIKG